MPLLLAIEPDSQQAEWIGEQARGPLGAELVVTESVQGAIKAIETRVPDLILTSTLLSPRDESTLQDYLRRMDSAGIRVQTLVIPMLAEPSASSENSGGMLSVLRKLRPGTAALSSGGCDPAVFGRQIAEYLERDSKKTQPGQATPTRGKKTEKGEKAEPPAFQSQPASAPPPPQQERTSETAPMTPGSVFTASDREWRPSPVADLDEFDTEALLSLLDQVALRGRGQQLRMSGESHPSHS